MRLRELLAMFVDVEWILSEKTVWMFRVNSKDIPCKYFDYYVRWFSKYNSDGSIMCAEITEKPIVEPVALLDDGNTTYPDASL